MKLTALHHEHCDLVRAQDAFLRELHVLREVEKAAREWVRWMRAIHTSGLSDKGQAIDDAIATLDALRGGENEGK